MHIGLRLCMSNWIIKANCKCGWTGARFALLWLSPKIGGTLTTSIMGGARQNKTSFTLLSLAP